MPPDRPQSIEAISIRTGFSLKRLALTGIGVAAGPSGNSRELLPTYPDDIQNNCRGQFIWREAGGFGDRKDGYIHLAI